MKKFLHCQQTKCNICWNWFNTYSENKLDFNVCESCVKKVIMDGCKLECLGVDGQFFRVFFVKSHASAHHEDSLRTYGDMLDQYKFEEFKQMMKKWEEIEIIIRTQLQKYESSEEFEELCHCVFEQEIKLIGKIKNNTKLQLTMSDLSVLDDQQVVCTPLRDKSENQLTPLHDSSFKAQNLKRSFVQSRRKENNSMKRSLLLPSVKSQTSPFHHNASLKSLTRVCSAFRLESQQEGQDSQKAFAFKMNNLKSSISSFLESENSINPVLHNIVKQKIYEVIENTNVANKCIELVSYQGLQQIDMKCYLKNLDWEGIEVVKFVRVGLTDQQLKDVLLQIQDKAIETLVLTGNNLTEEACLNLISFQNKYLKNVYLSKNQIFSNKNKHILKQLRAKYIVYI